ncbi:hypothetical protein G7B40_012055 [Aetokthonos hydrillicola Thurmond2011]|jgi:inner membrane protein involved in colicin E2 resistance|uniref:Uncharacterized protein n=1 Tax=Aetokthonos hydrillicola Thurmond2011 TaxID=2712845 RepID=A0AAP5MA89_9CYAN|nr:hypothetical protein [Aetokthonos hydrillicola]MBO3459078.1 hypothetical protein [Aetokthonos hydrillicola CCALA 1050]MBW4584748.1 hypothetical protein [Aetokthonos hydrillicola CCALA 1050]MDR9895294.1 hypothetical protein [Aetokthonos hydrillicola Thurmond2011]
MKTHVREGNSLLLKFVFKGLKYFLLALVGFAIAYVISSSLGVPSISTQILSLLTNWVFPIGVILLGLIGIAIILESLR